MTRREYEKYSGDTRIRPTPDSLERLQAIIIDPVPVMESHMREMRVSINKYY